MLEGDDLLRRYDVVANVEALDMALLEGIGKLFDVVHDDEVVANIEVLQRRVLLADDFAQLLRRLTRNLRGGDVTHLDAVGLDEALRDFETSIIANLLIVVEAQLLQTRAHGQ